VNKIKLVKLNILQHKITRHNVTEAGAKWEKEWSNLCHICSSPSHQTHKPTNTYRLSIAHCKYITSTLKTLALNNKYLMELYSERQFNYY